MCQAKSLGGKRCAIHHHGTQAAVQTTVVKTGIDTDDVKEVFSTLNKEGKKLPEPSRSEYESYLEKERFLTEIDQTIPARDKKMIIKKLEKAKGENTPSGGTFHAWQNLMSSALNKFGKKTRLVFAGITVAALSFGIAGCAPTNSSSGASIDGATSISIVQGEQITDALGTYSKITVDPNNPAFNTSAIQSIDMDSIKAAGYSEQDLSSAQKIAMQFTLTEMIDSKSLDTPDSLPQTLQDINTTYFTGPYASILSEPTSNIVYAQKDGLTFVRDGKPRIADTKTKISFAAGETTPEGLKLIDFGGVTETKYRVTTDSLVNWYKAKNPNLSDSQVKKDLKLDDSKEKTVTVTSNWFLTTTPDDSGNWKIAGYETSHSTILTK